jgi:alkylhydroperoxidase family enzyme
MAEQGYEDRQDFEMEIWPELRERWNTFLKFVFAGREADKELKQLVFLASSMASGCRHCQSHGAFHLNVLGVSEEKILSIWNLEESDHFTDAEKAALSLAVSAGASPNATEPHHFAEMRKHFTDIQIIEIMAVIAAGGFLNRWNDTIATVTDQESIDFAEKVLSKVGWDAGKHKGESHEQRKAHPLNLGWTK